MENVLQDGVWTAMSSSPTRRPEAATRPLDVTVGGMPAGRIIGESSPTIGLSEGDDETVEFEICIMGPADKESLLRIPRIDRTCVEWFAAPLRSRERREVRVRQLRADGSESLSTAVIVEAGLLEHADWAGDWVTVRDLSEGMPVLRREFMLGEAPEIARLYITYRGIGTAVLNGQRVSEDVLSPGWTSYPARYLATAHDVASLLRVGRNVLEVRLADGWYRGRLGFTQSRAIYGDELAVFAQLETDRAVCVVGDHNWRWTPGPIVTADLYDGETYDARREPIPWDDERGLQRWRQVDLVQRDDAVFEHPRGPMVSRGEEFDPISVITTPSGATILDFGVNLVGWARVRADLRSGQEIVLRHAEVLENGELGVRPLRTARATDRVIADAGGLDGWEPEFTYHGFRYLEVSGDWTPDMGGITAISVHNALARRGWFTTSHSLLQQLHDNVVRSALGNFVSIPTDCPQRDERLGWTGDIAVFAPTAGYLFDSGGMLRSWLRDMALEQGEDGLIPYFVPSLPFPEELQHDPIFRHTHTAVWGDASVLVPFALYQASGDQAFLAENYSMMARWVDGVANLAGPDGVWDEGFQFGDWLDPAAPPEAPADGSTEPSLVATAYLAHSARLVSRAAATLGFAAESDRFDGIHRWARDGFRARYVLPSGALTSDSQTAYALGIRLELLDGGARRFAEQRLVQLVRANGHRIGTGFVGTPLILDALRDINAIEDAYQLLLQTEVPSWLYAVTMGATSIWERWDSMLPDGSINPGEMTSFNHYALGAVADWLHSTVGGLSALEPGWRRIRIAPRPHPAIGSASTAHQTPFGCASVAWTLDETLEVDIVVPRDVVAIVDVPGREPFELLAGEHHFSVPKTADLCPQATA